LLSPAVLMLINFFHANLFGKDDPVTSTCGILDEAANRLLLMLFLSYYNVY